MLNLTAQSRLIPWNEELWGKLFKDHRTEFYRRKLRALKLFHEGLSRSEICLKLDVDYKTLGIWLRLYVIEGLNGLVKPLTGRSHPILTVEEQQQVKEMILTSSPSDHGIDRNIWTGEIIGEVIKTEFNKELHETAIYELLKRQGLSYQKAHRDYANADPEKQKEYIQNVKKNWKTKNVQKR